MKSTTYKSAIIAASSSYLATESVAKSNYYTSAIIAASTSYLATPATSLEIESYSSDPFTDLALEDYKFTKQRCPTKMLNKPNRNLCDDDCSTNKKNGTCTVSFLPTELQTSQNKGKACRCNPNEYFF